MRVPSLTHYLVIFIIITLIASLSPMATQAQTASIRMEGVTWNPSGDPISGVTVEAIEEGTGRQYQTTSDNDGYYRFLALPPGIYTVTAKSKDFKDVVIRNIELYRPDTVTQNLSFEAAAIDTEWTPAEQPRVNDAASTGAWSQRQMESLPIPDRDALSLLIYQPGIQIGGGRPSESTVNGARKGMNRILMDGLSITDPADPKMGSTLLSVNPDSIAAIQTVPLGAKAEYGGSGGGYFVISSRPGTKSWAGSIYDYFGNKNLNANEFFTNASNLPRTGYTRNILGATASGPLGSRTLLFANGEINRTNRTKHVNSMVLRESAREGLFQWYEPDDQTRDETTRRSFDIVANDPRGLGIDPTVAEQLAKFPADDYINNYIGDGLNTGGYLYEYPIHLRQERFTVRADHRLNNNHTLFFRFSYQDTDATDTRNSSFTTYAGTPAPKFKESSWALMGGSDLAINPRMVNELRIGYIRPHMKSERPGRSTNAMVILNSWSNQQDPSFPSSYKAPGFEVVDNFSHSLGVHALKYGAAFRRTLQERTDYSGVYPNVTLGRNHGNGVPSHIGPSEQSEITSKGREIFEEIYNDLLGRIESVSLTYTSDLKSVRPAGSPRQSKYASLEFSAFIQDDWKIRPNLTLNLGLRYDVFSSPKELNGYQSVLDKASLVSTSAEIADFRVSSSDKWYSTDWKNFAPRVGFAWDIRGNGSLVLRGAYGMYFDRLNGAVTRFVDQNSYGFARSFTVYPNANGTDWRLRDGIPLPAQPAPPSLEPSATRSSSVAVIDPNLRTPRVDQFHLTLEKRLWGAIFEVGYAGTRGNKLFQYTNLNQTKTSGDFLQAFQELQQYRDMGTPVPTTNNILKIFGTPMAAFDAMNGYNFDTGQAGIAANEMDLNYYWKYPAAGVSDFYIRNFPQFDRFLYGSNTAKSWYDSFQFGIRKTSANYQARFNYTYSKSLDTISSDGETYVSPGDSFNPEKNKAPSDFDRRHVLNFAFNYAIPFGRNLDSDVEQSPWVNGILGGWNLGVLYIRQSGARFSVYSGRETQYPGASSLASYDPAEGRPVGRLFRKEGVIYWFDPDQADLFIYPGAGEAGNSGRNSYEGPKYTNMDLVLHKKFTWKERRYLQLRIESFNIFNNTHFGLPIAIMGTDGFGTIRNTEGTPRSLQVALQLGF